ncbi:NAD(P)H-hydrate dehydratase [Nocardioides KLBMP 9356]|uniref:ADP-dependent (S)-NAD(P)H-hydrate dehydratase n=1 Tax=Nocardioides potassii TaxID=2911371 RepID=A0ABS9HBB8_9ACTN|nr:NAD(P)H-hydrate dehydratase [Nocardioides potassii]MCF6377524.1 NAD(P)H-hydrate dehydratase [Nocardioides potassii]
MEARGGTPESPRPVTPDVLRSWPLPETSGTKYARGQVLVVGGSCTTPGGVQLAGIAALRMGAGRLTIATAEGVAGQVAVALPECGTLPLPQDDRGAITGEDVEDLLAGELERADAVVLGPGLRSGDGAVRLVEAVGASVPDDVPVILDAAALTALPDVAAASVDRLAGRLVLTPNAGELAGMLGVDEVPDDDQARASLEAADRYGAVVGCGPLVAAGGEVWRVSTGDTGLGTSGSGDVVAGAVAGLLARGAEPVQATVWAKHVHAAAGDVLAARWGRVGYLATEMLPELPLVLRSLGGD